MSRQKRKKREKNRTSRMTKKLRKNLSNEKEKDQRQFYIGLCAHLNALKISSYPIPRWGDSNVPKPTEEHLKEYYNFCKTNGFKTNLDKTSDEKRKEILHVRRKTSDAQIKKRRKIDKNPRKIIQQIFLGEIDKNDLAQSNFRKLHDFINPSRNTASLYSLGNFKYTGNELEKVERLILKLLDESKLVDDALSLSQNTKRDYFSAILGMCHPIFMNRWLRDINEWKPKTHNARRQFSSFVRHLFAKYDVPLFMDSVWFQGEPKRKEWFLHIGAGNNIRTAEALPKQLTKKEAHYFMQAPDDYSALEAFRWGEVIALGGSAREMEAIRQTRIMNIHSEFWTSVIRFFIANPMLDTNHYGPIIDYIYNQRFANRQAFVRPGVFETLPPLQPNFSMKKRTVDALLRQVENWHVQLGKENKFKSQYWPSCGIEGYCKIQGTKEKANQVVWRIFELVTSDELRSEGRQLNHCVASYSHSCSSGQAAIYSLVRETFNGTKKLITIQVNLRNSSVVQARGYANRKIEPKERRILEEWANTRGLEIVSYL